MSEEYDTFFDEFKDIDLQLKLVKERDGKLHTPSGYTYTLSTEVPFEDGVYLTPAGAVVIIDGAFIGCVKGVFDKWGGSINLIQLLKPRYDAYNFTETMRTHERKVILDPDRYGYE